MFCSVNTIAFWCIPDEDRTGKHTKLSSPCGSQSATTGFTYWVRKHPQKDTGQRKCNDIDKLMWWNADICLFTHGAAMGQRYPSSKRHESGRHPIKWPERLYRRTSSSSSPSSLWASVFLTLIFTGRSSAHSLTQREPSIIFQQRTTASDLEIQSLTFLCEIMSFPGDEKQPWWVFPHPEECRVVSLAEIWSPNNRHLVFCCIVLNYKPFDWLELKDSTVRLWFICSVFIFSSKSP